MKRLALIPAVLAVGVVLSTPVWAYPGQDQGDPCQQPEGGVHVVATDRYTAAIARVVSPSSEAMTLDLTWEGVA